MHLARDGGGAHGADIGQVDVAAEIEWICSGATWIGLDPPMKTNNRPVEKREPIYLGRSPVNVDNLAVDKGQLRGRPDGIATAPPES